MSGITDDLRTLIGDEEIGLSTSDRFILNTAVIHINAAEAEIAAQDERIKTLEGLLKEVAEWISNWEPDFVDDPEWEDVGERLAAALRAT